MVKEFQVGKRYSWGNSPLTHLCIAAGCKRDGMIFGVFESEKGSIFNNFAPWEAHIVVPSRTGKAWVCYDKRGQYMCILGELPQPNTYYDYIPVEWKEVIDDKDKSR
jgi:hypothetical protein